MIKELKSGQILLEGCRIIRIEWSDFSLSLLNYFEAAVLPYKVTHIQFYINVTQLIRSGRNVLDLYSGGRAVTISILSRNMGYNEWSFSWLYSVHPGKFYNISN
jgi:hypothetical protein